MSATDTVTAPDKVRDALYQAVRYVLDRAQRDPDLGYHLGPFVEAWERLVTAEAEHLGQSLAEVWQRRTVDLQPPHDRRCAVEPALKKAARRAIDRLEALAQALDGRELAAACECMDLLSAGLEGRAPVEEGEE